MRVFDGKAVHERRSVLFDCCVIVDADFRGTPPVNYLSEAISKLGAGNRVEAYRMARDAGWL